MEAVGLNPSHSELINRKKKSMQKIIVLTVLLKTVIITTVFAQKEKIRVGLRGGLFLSRIDFKPALSREVIGDDAVYGGIQVQVPVAKNLYVVSEALYAISSLRFDNRATLLEQQGHVLIPVMLKYRIGKLGLYGGAQGQVLVSQRFDYILGGIAYSENYIDSSYRKLTWSGVVGAELVFVHRFGIDVRYQYGFSNMRADNGATVLTQFENSTIKMNAIQAGLFFRFGKKSSKKKSKKG
jgi:hypothetical protein